MPMNVHAGSSLMIAMVVVLPWAPLAGCGQGRAAPSCGNQLIEGDEQCDGTALAGQSCQTLGYYEGTLSCAPSTCAFDLSECMGSCGDSALDDGEQCEGTELDGETCETLGFLGGSLACAPADCTFDTTACTGGHCGNGLREAEEMCDGTDIGNETCEGHGYFSGTPTCSKTCELELDSCFEAPTIPVGEPCHSTTDCTGGQCWQEVSPWLHDIWGPQHYGYPGGYCIEFCDPDRQCREAAAIAQCVGFSNGTSVCLRDCDPNASTNVCRPGYRCYDLDDGSGVCYPSCDDDSQCTITGHCETNAGSPAPGWCHSPPEDCANGQDEDFDNQADCADLECVGQDPCPPGEFCGNGVDDDGDGATDCMDADCAFSVLCTGEVCTPAPGAVLTCGVAVSGSNDAPGSTNVIRSPCRSPGKTGSEFAYILTVDTPQLVTVSLGNFQGDLDLYVLRDTQDASCDATDGCQAASLRPIYQAEELTFTAFASTQYYVVVGTFTAAASFYDLAVSCDPTAYEDCTNGQDDDGDELADCEDPDCFGQMGCTTEHTCLDGQDNDWDGDSDCRDADCATDPACRPAAGYWELWERAGGEEMDLVGSTVSYTVDASHAQGYTHQLASGVTVYPVTPGSGDVATQALSIPDDSTVEIALPTAYSYFGIEYQSLYIGDDGYVSLADEEGHHPGPGGWNLLHHPRIAPLWGDLDPALGGTITLDVFSDHVTITWDGLINKSSGQVPNRFQLTLWNSGNIQMTWLAVDSVANLPTSTAGYVTLLGDGQGLPPPESDFLP